MVTNMCVCVCVYRLKKGLQTWLIQSDCRAGTIYFIIVFFVGILEFLKGT